MKYFLFLIGMCGFSLLSAQEVEVKRERVFTGTGLYGFMNGGADLYMEYGVKNLTVRDVVFEGDDYTVEIYEMPSQEDAFGIYSLHTFKCQRADTLGCLDCLSPYQLQAVSGNKYVSVVFPSGSRVAMAKADEVIRKYVSMDSGENPVIPEVLTLEPPYSGRLKYLRGSLSVSTANFALSALLEGIPYTGIWYASERRSPDYCALILLPDNQNVEQLKKKFPPANILKSGNTFLYISGRDTPSLSF
jgi:hypothetical protein